MSTYNAAEIIGKTLIANKEIDVYRGNDLNDSVYVVKPGQPVGVVLSYLSPNDKRQYFYWMFEDSNGRAYYTRHTPGAYNIKSIKEQGALTAKEKEQEAKDAEATIFDKVLKVLKGAALLGGVVYLAGKAIEKK